MSWGAVAAAGVGLVGGIMASNASSSASESAADASTSASKYSADIQKQMFDKTVSLQEPFYNAGVSALKKLKTADATGGASQYTDQLSNLTTPTTTGSDIGDFNFELNTEDPVYQWKLKEAQKAIDAASAARGNYNSRAAINASGDAAMDVTAQEVEDQYNRALSAYETNRTSDLANYQSGYQSVWDTYNADYGKLSDLYNMASQTGQTKYGQLYDLVNIGQGSASTTGSAATATGQGISSTYANLANNLTNAYTAQGQAQSDLYSGIGSSAINSYMMYNLLN